jgi:hypothetical protein
LSATFYTRTLSRAKIREVDYRAKIREVDYRATTTTFLNEGLHWDNRGKLVKYSKFSFFGVG